MKSIQIELARYISSKEKLNYSELQVLRSGAGFYIGTIYTDPKTKFQEPGSRDSTYFVHKEIADQALAELEKLEAAGFDDFVFRWEFWLHNNGLDPNCVGYRMDPSNLDCGEGVDTAREFLHHAHSGQGKYQFKLPSFS